MTIIIVYEAEKFITSPLYFIILLICFLLLEVQLVENLNNNNSVDHENKAAGPANLFIKRTVFIVLLKRKLNCQIINHSLQKSVKIGVLTRIQFLL